MSATRHRGTRPGVRHAAWAGVVSLLVAVPMALAGQAQAATPGTSVSFATTCTPGVVPAIHGTTITEIAVDNATPKVGDTVTVTYDVTQPASGNPTSTALPANVILPSGVVQLGGAQTGTVAVTGTRTNPPVAGNAPFPPFQMTGTFKVTTAGSITLTPGNYTINSNYIINLDTPCTIDTPPAPVSNTITAGPVTVPNNRAITDNPSSGPTGTKVTVTGTGFTAAAAITVAGFSGTTATGDATTATADSSGAFSATLTVNAASTTGIIAFEGTSYDPTKAAPPAAYSVTTVTPPGGASQTLNSSVKGGTLSMTQAGSTVTMTPVDFGTGGSSTGSLNAVTVKDFRGVGSGWSLTASNTNFTGPGGSTLPAADLSWTPACSTTAGSPSTCAAGSAGPVGTAGATLASTPAATLTGGQFGATANLSLSIPAFTAPGTYSSTLTLTLA
ncbi:WxL domain-containing protein [Streptacidiphilus sp. MAP12-16]|uniref:WxL domain-containing protein n=1 Tax=Streptacidiphilus sp. MAP12-16 TaxID=3156300 RepID=UPI003516D5DB